MLMLAVTTAVFVPLLANGTAFGHVVRGSVAPAGVPVIAGAFLFGIGMQLGGGCASGTLFSAGGGSVRMFATLAAFIVGSVLGVRYSGVWEQAPALRPMSLLGEFGARSGAAHQPRGFAAIAGVSMAIETRRRGALETERHARTGGADRSLDARGWRAGSRRGEHRDAADRRPTVGHHRRLRVVGFQGC